MSSDSETTNATGPAEDDAELAQTRAEVPRTPSPQVTRSGDLSLSDTIIPESAGALAPVTLDFGLSDPEARLEAHRVIGEGGMAQVLLGHDTALHRDVAIKRIREDVARHPRLLKRFLAEVQITAQLEHPNIVPVYDLDQTGSGSYTMKLIRGQTLDGLLDKAKDEALRDVASHGTSFGLTGLLELFLKVCDAIGYAHSKGVIHRDLKPSNIMVGRHGEVYVVDWGVARVLNPSGGTVAWDVDDPGDSIELEDTDHVHSVNINKTKDGTVIGTLSFLSPEQAWGRVEQVDARSDVYVLGLILFEIVTLQRALQGASSDLLLERARKGALARVAHVTGIRLPPELRAIIEHATARAREDRYQSVQELADDIRRFLRDEPVMARRDAPLRAITRWISHHARLVTWIVLVLLLSIAGVVMVSLWREKQAAEVARMRETQLTRFFSVVVRQRDDISEQLLRTEGALLAFASATEQSLLHGQPSSEPLYTNDDFVEGGSHAPPDLEMAPRYTTLMSMDWPLNFLPKGESSADHEDAARRLSPLRRLVQRLQLESYPREGLSELDDASRRRLLTVEGTPLSWMYLGLESGLLWQVPGNRIERPDYDPRVRPWYRNAVDASNQRPVWGAPYVEATTFRKVVPCSVEMRDPQGRRLGVASLDMMFDYIIDTMMMVPGIDDDAQTTYIVDAQGQILVDSSESRRGDGSEALDGARATRHFHVPEVIASMAQSETALVEVERSGEEFLYGVAPMQVAGWWFIVEVKTSTVLASEL